MIGGQPDLSVSVDVRRDPQADALDRHGGTGVADRRTHNEKTMRVTLDALRDELERKVD